MHRGAAGAMSGTAGIRARRGSGHVIGIDAEPGFPVGVARRHLQCVLGTKPHGRDGLVFHSLETAVCARRGFSSPIRR